MSHLSVSPTNQANYHHASSPASSTVSDDDSAHSEPNDLRVSRKLCNYDVIHFKLRN